MKRMPGTTLASILAASLGLFGCSAQTADLAETDGEIGQAQSALTQNNAPWHLDRLDQVNLPLNGSYSYNYTGNGITVYVLSTGVNTNHVQFGGRAATINVNNLQLSDPVGTGTQLAGVVAGTTTGVAKQALIRSIPVQSSAAPPTEAALINALQWIYNNHPNTSLAMVLIGTPLNATTSAAVWNAIALVNSSVGYVVMPVAANATAPTSFNNNAFIRVSGTDATDAAAFGPNYATFDIRAPATNILTTSNTSTTATVTGSDPALAAAVVAGLGATYLQKTGIIPPVGFKTMLLNTAITIPSTATDGVKLASMGW